MELATERFLYWGKNQRGYEGTVTKERVKEKSKEGSSEFYLWIHIDNQRLAQ